MQSAIEGAAVLNTSTSKKMIWAGRILSGLPALFLLADSVGKFVKPAAVVEGTIQLGYPESVILPLGIVLLSLRFALRDSAHVRAWRDLADGLSWRRNRHPRARRQPTLHPHLVPGLLCRADLGRAVLAPRQAARAHPVAKVTEVMTESFPQRTIP